MAYNDEEYRVKGNTYQRVTKTQARKLHMAGYRIAMLPSKANPYFMDGGLFGNIRKGRDFDTEVNAYCYYNCNSELGKTIKYFVVL